MVRRLPAMRPEIEDALRRVPRHEFVTAEWRREAYRDEPLPLPASEATISAPHMVALQLEAASVRPGDHVLEVGTGLGYLSALLAELAGTRGRVLTIEVDPGLAREAKVRLARTGYADRVEVRCGDGRTAVTERGAYDRVVVSCATPTVERLWVEALRPNGVLVAPVGGPDEQVLIRLEKGPDGVRLAKGVACRFVPLHSSTPPHI